MIDDRWFDRDVVSVLEVDLAGWLRSREVKVPFRGDPWQYRQPGWEPGGVMLDRLTDVDLSRLSDAERIEWAVAIDRCHRHAEAVRARALAAAAGVKHTDAAKDAAVLTLAGQLTQSPIQTGHQVTFAREMVTRFPDTLAAAQNGEIPMAHAKALYEETAHMTPEQCSQVEQAVLGKASKRTPYQHTRAVRKAVNKIAPRPEPEEPGSPEDERRAEVRDAGPWSTGLWMQGPTEQMAVIAARMAAATSVPKSPEDPRTFPHRRYDSIFDAVQANTSVFVDLVAYANPDGTISLPSLPGIEDLTPDQLAKIVAGGTLRLHNPDLKPPATDSYEWTAAQRRYLQARDRICRFPGCRVAAERCELDHITPYAAGGATDVDQGLCLCKRHHRVKHQPGWKIVRFDDNTVEWTSPTGHITIDHPWNNPDDQ